MKRVPARTILLVEDAEVFRTHLARALRARRLEVRVAGDFEGAQESVGANSPDFALIDLKLPGRSGLEVISELAARSPRTRVFLLTGSLIPSIAEAAHQRGALGCLKKPVDADQIIAELKAAGDRS
jgi:two-component system, response regulator RegA